MKVIRARLRWVLPTTLSTATGIAALVRVAVGDEGIGDWAAITAVAFGVFALWLTLDALGLTDEKLLVPRDPSEARVKQLVTRSQSPPE